MTICNEPKRTRSASDGFESYTVTKVKKSIFDTYTSTNYVANWGKVSSFSLNTVLELHDKHMQQRLVYN